jgi:hypothetical protein
MKAFMQNITIFSRNGFRSDTSRQVHSETQRIASQWRGAPPVYVVPTFQDLPVAAPSDARGLFLNGEVFIVASQSPRDLAATITHEVVAHHGLRQHLNGSWQSFMLALASGARADGNLTVLRSQVRDVYGPLPAIIEADELAAAMVELHTCPHSGKYLPGKPARKRVAAATGHFAREHLYVDIPVDQDQLQGALLAAQHRLRYGGACWGLGRRIRECYAAVMTKPWNPKDPPIGWQRQKNLLDAEESRRTDLAEWKGLAIVFGLFAAAFILVVAIGYLGYLGISFLSRFA